MSTSDDLVRRWREAKLGDRVGGRVLVSIECEGDPRAEVLGAFDAARNERIERGVAFMEKPLVTMPAPGTWRETVGVSDPPEAFGLPSGGATGGEVVISDVDRETGTVTIGDRPPRRERTITAAAPGVPGGSALRRPKRGGKA